MNIHTVRARCEYMSIGIMDDIRSDQIYEINKCLKMCIDSKKEPK